MTTHTPKKKKMNTIIDFVTYQLRLNRIESPIFFFFFMYREILQIFILKLDPNKNQILPFNPRYNHESLTAKYCSNKYSVITRRNYEPSKCVYCANVIYFTTIDVVHNRFKFYKSRPKY